ncbi:archaetidylserine decarboxylase [Kistimonas asteriae]|uniref:archaetidylserine decarboxylase n=1 Tax=Kistimonas asteriae TaxID=517724 RepID=UPI001BA9E915|nr:archaetidylserine decarboxylase [Kistimonas asteriae]
MSGTRWLTRTLTIVLLLCCQSLYADGAEPSQTDPVYRISPGLQELLPHHLINDIAYSLAEKQWPWLKNWLIRDFIKKNTIDMSEAALQNPEDYLNFNDFFTRALKEGARPQPDDPSLVSSPVDGTVSQIGWIENDRIIQAKQHDYSLKALLAGNDALADTFDNGLFSTIYLSPGDYHRVHMPITGTLRKMAYVPGDLYSVNQETTDSVENLYARNERVISIFDTEYGPMAVIMVGAMVVGSMETVWAGEVKPDAHEVTWSFYDDTPIALNRGDEMGRFKLGSTVIVLFSWPVVSWLEDHQPGSKIRMGEGLAKPK